MFTCETIIASFLRALFGPIARLSDAANRIEQIGIEMCAFGQHIASHSEFSLLHVDSLRHTFEL